MNSRPFPPEGDTRWEKGHGRLDRRQLVRVAVSPEEIGLHGCWQVIAVKRQRELLGPKASAMTEETGFYVSSVAVGQLNEKQLIEAIRGHWGAAETGSHYRRDVSLGEDASQVSDRTAANVLATLRNLAIGLFELEHKEDEHKGNGLKSWCRSMTFSKAYKLIT